MKCPECTETDLVMTERQGVEIDYCPKCRGVWLDRGELDKIIERSMPAQAHQSAPVGRGDESAYSGHGEHYDKHSNKYGHQRKKSWLGEMFD
jgi:Zn-finger nucleic acid-binding protein